MNTIEKHFDQQIQRAAEVNLQEILRLVRYRKEIAWYARQTQYKGHRQLYRDASRRLKTLLAL